MRKNAKEIQQAGITLIALVVTIIVLLILAGVTLNLVLGQNGVINKGQYASNTWANATKDEDAMMRQMENDVDTLATKFQGGSGDEDDTVDTYAVGDLVTLAGEDFYVIKDNGDTVTLITKLCVETTNYTQSSTVNPVSYDNDTSTSIYANASISGLVNNYVTNFKTRWNKPTATVSGRLLTLEDLEDLGFVRGCELGLRHSCFS